MDLITKVILINAITMIFALWVDKKLLDDITETMPRLRSVLGGWALLTVCSIFFWLMRWMWGWL